MAIAKWVGALDTAKMNRALDGEDLEEPRDAARSETAKSATSPSETLVQLPDVTSRALKH
jgi:DAACS family dicarboxylate/amino acid:cation (Na+ or H+) symporter/aerobic C4-dicarboxylate transport protein